MKNTLSDIAAGFGRGVLGIASFGGSEFGRAQARKRGEREKEERLALARIMSGQTIPAFARPGGAEPSTPEEIKQAQMAQIAELGTPASLDLLSRISPLVPQDSSMTASMKEFVFRKDLQEQERLDFDLVKRASKLTGKGLRQTPEGIEVIPGFQKGIEQVRRAAETGTQKAKLEFEPQTAREIEKARIGVKGTPAEIALDKAFAIDWQKYRSGGGVTAIKKNLNQLLTASKALAKRDDISGPVIGSMPDLFLAFINPDAINIREIVQEVAQRNLRLILGGQFAQREGEQLIARVYNPRLSEEVNRQRIKVLFTQIKEAAEIKEQAGAYFTKHGTLRGWDGTLPTLADFEPDKGGEAAQGDAAIDQPDGQTAVNPQTGQTIIFRGGQWQPL